MSRTRSSDPASASVDAVRFMLWNGHSAPLHAQSRGGLVLGKKTKDQEGSQAASARIGSKAQAPTSVISRDMRITGDCIVEGRIRIEGTIVGDVSAAGLELARSGSVQGDLTAAKGAAGEPFVIAGEVQGRVHAPQVEVGPNGSILGGVEADEAQIRGRVENGIVARKRLTLEETAVVEGDVRAKALALKEGGQVNGTIIMGERATSTGGDEETSKVDLSPEGKGRSVPRAVDETQAAEATEASETTKAGRTTDAGEGAAA
ncbi:MAG: hypothetical protein HKN73_15155 [Gemmatimonadetes bacterium]|nr:hypothetical protein [Gemmatimonadota bacterium]